MTGLNVYQKLCEVAKAIGSQEWAKSQKNTAYASVPIDAMRGAVREACAKNGLVHVGPYDIQVERFRVERTTYLTGFCRFRYVNAEKPEESVEYESIGEAMDNGDKGTGKLETNLIKNHYKAAFDIGEQGKDDIDSYSNEEFYAEAESIARKQAASKASADAFFSKKAKPTKAGPEMADTKPEFTPANKIPTDAEIVAYIDVRGKMPAYKEVVKSFKIDKKANSTYELSISDRAELYSIIKDMEESL